MRQTVKEAVAAARRTIRLEIRDTIVDRDDMSYTAFGRPGTDIKETTVSSQMKPLLRLGLVREAGMRPSDETGRFRIVWALGPGAGEHNLMPQVKAGPQQKLKLRLFEKSEVIRILQSTQQEGHVFQNLTNALNTELPRRVY